MKVALIFTGHIDGAGESFPHYLRQIQGSDVITQADIFASVHTDTGQSLRDISEFHQYFADSSVDDGCSKLIAEATSVENLENTFIELLENDSKNVHKIADKSWFKLNKFFSTFNFRFGSSKLNYSACLIKGKDNGNELKAFYADIIQ